MNITFEPLTHTYTNAEGKELISVTTAIRKYIQPDLYAGVPTAILNAAAERGTNIHAHIDALEKGIPFADTDDIPEMVSYKKWREQNIPSDMVVRTEQIVSDGEIIAGTIDMVAHNGNETWLFDVKTTYALNIEYLRWQLSLYAYCLGGDISRFGCLWVHDGECKEVEIERVPSYAVESLLDAIKHDISPDEWRNPMYAAPDDAEALVSEYRKLSIEIADYAEVVDIKNKRMNAILEELKAIGQREGKDKMQTSAGLVTISKDATRKTFSKDLFLSKYPEFEEMLKEGMKESIIIGKAKIKL